jgi:transcriptional regulator with XRE-family HTH domain
MKKDETQNAFNKKLGKNIQRILKSKKIKQVELLKIFKTSSCVISSWICGVSTMTPLNLFQISEFLEVDLAVLVGKKKGNVKTHSYITSHNWQKAHRLFEILKETNNLSHITSEEYNGSALSHLIWEHHIETLLEECKGMGTSELSVEFFTLLKELEGILQEEKAEFLLIDNQ